MVDAAGGSATVPDYKAFRTVTTPASSSMLYSNLSAKDGTSFITCKNTDKGGNIYLYGPSVVTQEEDTVEPTLTQVSHKSDAIRAQFHQVKGTWYVVVCHLDLAIIFNANCTRRLFSFEISKAVQEASGGRAQSNSDPVQKHIWFTCSTKAYDQDSEEEFLLLATNDGRIFSVTIEGGAQFVTDNAFTMSMATPIVAMAVDPRSKVLLMATGQGQTLLLKPKIDEEWGVVQPTGQDSSLANNPATCAEVMGVGLAMFVVGYASGAIKLFLCATGQLVCEIGAHSRQVNALVTHPTRMVFASAGDDTFVNLWEITGSQVERLDINILTSSIVNDYQVVGLAFGQENHRSVVASVYDYKVLLVWDDIL